MEVVEEVKTVDGRAARQGRGGRRGGEEPVEDGEGGEAPQGGGGEWAESGTQIGPRAESSGGEEGEEQRQ